MSTQRELKFRALFDSGSVKKWMHASLFDGDWTSQTFACACTQLSPWLQYTGLKDRNGREICEGDVVRFKIGGEDFKRPVVWNPSGMWSIQWPDQVNPGPLRGTYEVIGNIYENPELLQP
jgi:hypothetical protein